MLQKDTAADLLVAKTETVLLKKGRDQDMQRNMKKNLIFDGITFADTDDLSKIIADTLKNKMKIEIDIDFDAVHKLGQSKSIIVGFHRMSDRFLVWQSRRNPKGSSVYVREQYPANIERDRNTMRPL